MTTDQTDTATDNSSEAGTGNRNAFEILMQAEKNAPPSLPMKRTTRYRIQTCTVFVFNRYMLKVLMLHTCKFYFEGPQRRFN